MSKTISANSGAIKLTSSSDNPLIILGGVTVSGSSYGVSADGSLAWAITNQGTVTGAAGDGIDLAAGGSVTNSGAAAHISGAINGVNIINGAAAITNQGTIVGASVYGVFLKSGTVTNSGTAADITGGKWGIFAAGSGPTTVTNGGTISGATGAVHFGNANGNVFRVLPGAVTTGIVQGGTGVDTLALGAAHSFGFISGIGSQFTGFEVLEVDNSAIGQVKGANTLGTSATIALPGSGSLRVTGTLIAPANLTITGDGTLAASGGRIEVGTSHAALANQIVVDAGGTLITSGALTAPVIRNNGIVSGSYGFGVRLVATGSVTNSGGISGTDAGVFAAGGVLTLSNSGTGARITGGLWGVYASADAATITNQGSIASTFGYGVYVGAGGTVTNSGSSSSIAGGVDGVIAITGAATITNEGSIAGGSGDGVTLGAGGSVTNGGAAASIRGGVDGVDVIGGAATITNPGSITGASGDGVYLGAGGSVTGSGAAARIQGGRWGVYVAAGAATVTNSGTVSGGTGAVHFANTNGNVLQLLPGAVTSGVVQGGTGKDTLELGSSATTGTITGIGSKFTGFETLEVDTGAKWVMPGSLTIGATPALKVVGTGSLGVEGTLTETGNLTLTGTGTLAASGGRIEIGASAAALAGQIRVDTGHTLNNSGVLSASKLVVASGALLTGSGRVAGAVGNAGTVKASGGTLQITGNVTGGGTLQAGSTGTLVFNGASNAIATVLDNNAVVIGSGNTLNITGSVEPGSTGVFVLDNNSLLKIAADTGHFNQISFASLNGELVVEHVAKFGTNVGKTTYEGPHLEHFGGTGLKIDLKDLNFAGLSGTFLGGEELQLASGTTKATLLFDPFTLGGTTFHTANDGSGHVLLTRT